MGVNNYIKQLTERLEATLGMDATDFSFLSPEVYLDALDGLVLLEERMHSISGDAIVDRELVLVSDDSDYGDVEFLEDGALYELEKSAVASLITSYKNKHEEPLVSMTLDDFSVKQEVDALMEFDMIEDEDGNEIIDFSGILDFDTPLGAVVDLEDDLEFNDEDLVSPKKEPFGLSGGGGDSSSLFGNSKLFGGGANSPFGSLDDDLDDLGLDFGDIVKPTFLEERRDDALVEERRSSFNSRVIEPKPSRFVEDSVMVEVVEQGGKSFVRKVNPTTIAQRDYAKMVSLSQGVIKLLRKAVVVA